MKWNVHGESKIALHIVKWISWPTHRFLASLFREHFICFAFWRAPCAKEEHTHRWKNPPNFGTHKNGLEYMKRNKKSEKRKKAEILVRVQRSNVEIRLAQLKRKSDKIFLLFGFYPVYIQQLRLHHTIFWLRKKHSTEWKRKEKVKRIYTLTPKYSATNLWPKMLRWCSEGEIIRFGFTKLLSVFLAIS